MERDQNAAATNLLDRENKIIADILSGFRGLMMHAAEKVDNTASAGQAAYNSMAIEIHMNGLIKSTEDLLQLTRQLRELWVVGPLKRPREGDTEAEESMRKDISAVSSLLGRLRNESRQKMVQESNGTMTYISGPIQGPPPPPITTAATAQATQGQQQQQPVQGAATGTPAAGGSART
ncbi:hypothetical protein QBC46DRAFT_394912 [Diplogelasinospora grovesii]|uniref:Mediator of RNA polymerase II transcription subunit 22 n=1 Tax=Diplogelasinospora grovesii TaxID=303347 RepID=A0AAN6N1M1_9PEZI|nr:hypothetical protein QBC46DRAFT_394912 [Diplogelasinospora grovesii]